MCWFSACPPPPTPAPATAGLNATWTIFNGFVLPYSQIPVYWKWMNRITPTTWILYALSVSQLGDVNTPVRNFNGTETTVSEFMAVSGMDRQRRPSPRSWR
jgi:ABC-2 type transporter